MLERFFNGSGAAYFGAVPLSELGGMMTAGATDRLRRDVPGVKSVIMAAFPYLFDMPRGNVSLYARGVDYHNVLAERLGAVAAALGATFHSNIFRVYVDASPIPEKAAANLCGIGVIGKHSLLITPRHGSFVFLGSIATDLCMRFGSPSGRCQSCGECFRACPVGALESSGFIRERCLSHITQKKGVLSGFERTALLNSGSVWGCDICQLACPMNRYAARTGVAEWARPGVSSLRRADIADETVFTGLYKKYVFLWRGFDIIKRNINIFSEE